MSLQLMLAAPAQAQTLTAEQSLCLVKVFLNASIGCICFARGLIPPRSPTYQDRRVDDLALITTRCSTYADFLSFPGELSTNRNSQQFKILLRGRDKRADHILDLLEIGIFDAVDRGFLDAVQFSLCLDENELINIIECYTFSFRYSQGKTGRKVSSVQISPASEDEFFIGAAQKSFRKVIRSLLVLCQGLAPLPHRRSLGVNLLYNTDCPSAYEPHGFASSTNFDVLFPDDAAHGWSKQGPEDVGSFSAGSYHIEVAASYLKPGIQERLDSSQIPQSIGYKLTSSRVEDLAISKQLKQMQRSSSIPSCLTPTEMDLSGRIITTVAARRTISDQLQSHSQAQNDILTTSLARQSQVDIPCPPNGTPMVSSQGTKRSNTFLGTDVHSRRTRNVLPAKMAELIIQAWAREINNPSLIYLFDIDELKKNHTIKRLDPGRIIHCECQSKHEEEEMSLCELCAFWQHDRCYGYKGIRDIKRPSEHFCYSCLLLPRAKDINDRMPSVVRMRVALNSMFDHGTLTQSQAQQLIDQETLTSLEQEGFLHKMKGGYATTKDPKKISQAKVNFLDPLVNISDYYVAFKDKETPQDRPRAIKEALDEYTGGKDLVDDDNVPELDEWRCTDAFGNVIIRWGYYPERPIQDSAGNKRIQSVPQAESLSRKKPRMARKMSQSKIVVNLDALEACSSEAETEDASTTF